MKENGKFYGVEHFELMQKIFQRFLNKLVITPHILSEINMLSRKVKEPHFSAYFSKVVEQLQKCREETIELKVILKNGHTRLIQFGFTDIALVELAKREKWAILTDEFDMYRIFSQIIPVINFSNVATREIYRV